MKFLKENWKEYLGGIIGLVLFCAFLIWLFSPSPTFDKFVNNFCYKNVGVLKWTICSFIFNIDYSDKVMDTETGEIIYP